MSTEGSTARSGWDPVTLGSRVRHFRKRGGLTLSDLAARVGCAPSHLSLIENGRREPRVSLLHDLATHLGVTPADLLEPLPPDPRAELEIAVAHAQADPRIQALGLPHLRSVKSLASEVLRVVVGLYQEVLGRDDQAPFTPEEARRANAALRRQMRERGNYFGEIEQEAADILTSVGHTAGPIGERRITQIAEHLGFTLHFAADLPNSTRSVTDQRHRRIYLPQGGSPTHDTRAVILQTLGHQVLNHTPPRDYAEFLRQRVEANYFAAAILIPEMQAADMLKRAKSGRYLAVEDFRDTFSVSYETASHRFTNLVTHHLGMKVYFLKVFEDGTIYKAYENNGLKFPTDATGAIEGQKACQYWTARQSFLHASPGSTYWQHSETAQGAFWAAAQVQNSATGRFAVSVGVRAGESKWFRGRETTNRMASRCPDPSCCRTAPEDLTQRWAHASWPSARAHAHLLATLPPGTFPGVDATEVFQFLDRHAPSG